MHGRVKNVFNIVIIKPEGIRKPARPRCKLKDWIKKFFKEKYVIL
jgi:hypothetical protein